jgi:hypothetical protein
MLKIRKNLQDYGWTMITRKIFNRRFILKVSFSPDRFVKFLPAICYGYVLYKNDGVIKNES